MPLSRWAAERGTTAEEWLSRFHLWELSWDEASMRISLDGEIVNTLDPGAAAENPPGLIPARPFQEKHYLLLNLAIGGNNGGTPDGQNVWPMKYEIDYVRYYVK
jgi:beta-glucanase (GH16 family)